MNFFVLSLIFLFWDLPLSSSVSLPSSQFCWFCFSDWILERQSLFRTFYLWFWFALIVLTSWLVVFFSVVSTYKWAYPITLFSNIQWFSSFRNLRHEPGYYLPNQINMKGCTHCMKLFMFQSGGSTSQTIDLKVFLKI